MHESEKWNLTWLPLNHTSHPEHLAWDKGKQIILWACLQAPDKGRNNKYSDANLVRSQEGRLEKKVFKTILLFRTFFKKYTNLWCHVRKEENATNG